MRDLRNNFLLDVSVNIINIPKFKTFCRIWIESYSIHTSNFRAIYGTKFLYLYVKRNSN